MSMKLPFIRARFISEIGVALVLLAALMAAIASTHSVTAYLGHPSFGCGTFTRPLQDFTWLWYHAVTMLSLIGIGLARVHKLGPHLCSLGLAVTIVSSVVALVVVGDH